MTTRNRKPAPTQDPWTQQETKGRDFSPLVGPAFVVAAILAAGFVWFTARTIGSGSGFGRTLAWLLNAFAVVLVAGSIVGVGIAVYAGAQRARRVVPKEDGRFPMLYRHLDQPAAAAMTMDRITHARLLEGGRALPPGVQSVSQSQSTSTFEVNDEPEIDESALTESALVTWADLERASAIGPGQPPVIGWDMINQSLVRLDRKRDLGTIFFLGMSGSGKSTTAAGYAAQALIDGGTIIVCDPHADDDESLAALMGGLAPGFARPVAQSEREVLETVVFAHSIFKDREAGDKDRSPVLVFIDEWTSLLMSDVGTKLDKMLVNIAVQGRKFGVDACLFAQLGTKQECGLVRNAATSTFAFRVRGDEARFAIGRRVDIDLRNYRDGQMYVQARREVFERVQSPLITAGELTTIGQQIAPEPEQDTRGPLSLVQDTGATDLRWGMSLDDDDQFDREEELRVVALKRRGMQVPQIVAELRGVPPGGTRRYRKLRDAVEAIITAQINTREEQS